MDTNMIHAYRLFVRYMLAWWEHDHAVAGESSGSQRATSAFKHQRLQDAGELHKAFLAATRLLCDDDATTVLDDRLTIAT